jgi:hypothetical protein
MQKSKKTKGTTHHANAQNIKLIVAVAVAVAVAIASTRSVVSKSKRMQE